MATRDRAKGSQTGSLVYSWLDEAFAMATDADQSTETDIYADLISDHKCSIVKEIDMDQLLNDFKYKDAINKQEYTKLSNEKDSETKSNVFLDILLKRRRLQELKELLHLITRNVPEHYLKTVLKTRLDRYNTSKHKRGPSSTSDSHVVSAGGSSIKNQATEDGAEEVVFLRLEKQNLEEDLDVARRDIEDREEVIRILSRERDTLEGELEEARGALTEMQNEISGLQSVNTDLQSQLKDAKSNIEHLQSQLATNTTEIGQMKTGIVELKDELKSMNRKLNEIRPHKKPQKSKMCLIM